MKRIDLKKIREKQKLSQADFGAKLGVSMRTIQNWESGNIDIPGPKAQLIRYVFEESKEIELESPDNDLVQSLKDQIRMLKDHLETKDKYIRLLETQIMKK